MCDVGEIMSIRKYDELEQRVTKAEWNLYNLNDRLSLDMVSLDLSRIIKLEKKIEELERRLNAGL